MRQPKIRRTAEQRYVNSNGFAEKQRGGPTRVDSMELPCSSTGRQSRRRNATIEIHLARASVPAAVLERTTAADNSIGTVTTSAPCVQVSLHASLALAAAVEGGVHGCNGF
jgi:hypothetical protein